MCPFIRNVLLPDGMYQPRRKQGDTSKKQTEQQEEIKKAETQDINDVHLRDKDSLYEK